MVFVLFGPDRESWACSRRLSSHITEFFWPSDGLLPQMLPRGVEVGQRHKAEHLRGIFEQPTITHLAIAELAFDNAEDVLDLGSDDPMFSVACVLRRRQGAASLTLIFDRPENAVSPRCPFAFVAHVVLSPKIARSSGRIRSSVRRASEEIGPEDSWKQHQTKPRRG